MIERVLLKNIANSQYIVSKALESKQTIATNHHKKKGVIEISFCD